MYCQQCGNVISSDDRFCNHCGNQNQFFSANADSASNGTAAKTGQGKSKKSRLLILGAIAAAVAVVILIVVLSSNSVRLKYDWGTDFDTIIEKEGDAVYRSDRDRYEYDHIEAHDEKHKIDRLKEFNISSEGVLYVLRGGKLLRLRYYFTNDYSGKEVAEIISSYYGDDYYVRGTEYIWWEDGTVVRVDMYDKSIAYYDEIDYLEAHDSYYERYASEDILEYFGKERYEEE